MKISKLDNTKLYYLASPYSGKTKNKKLNKQIENKRFEAVTSFAAKLFVENEIKCILPITTSHIMAKVYKKPLGVSWDYWKRYDTKLVESSDVLLVLCLDGLEESTGVQAEIELAKEFGKPIYYVDPETLEVSRKPR